MSSETERAPPVGDHGDRAPGRAEGVVTALPEHARRPPRLPRGAPGAQHESTRLNEEPAMPRSYASAVINASADEVWSYVRDFANLGEWLSSIETCEIEGGGDVRVGSV